MLRTLDAIFRENAAVAGEKFAVVQDLVGEGLGREDGHAERQQDADYADWNEEWNRPGCRFIAIRDAKNEREDQEVRQHGRVSGA